MQKPNLTFFTELPAEELKGLFDDQAVVDRLVNLGATVSLGILDLSNTRAGVVKNLNQAGVPVVAWLLLPEEEGYWFNIENFDAAAARYVNFKAWTSQHGLKWDAIGLDIEMDINELRQILEEKQGGKFASIIFRRFFDKQRVFQAQRAYQALVELIHADGYPVESYHIPLISEERRANASVLQRALGLVDLKTDREVLMLYSSFLRPDGAAVLWSYAPEADSVGVGNTGGGVVVKGVIDLGPLSWEEFARDLRLCAMREKPIHIFCLEGCARQGFLEKLETFDWETPASMPDRVRKVNVFRAGITALLWILERPWVLLIALVSLIGMRFLFQKGDKH